jgi:NTP pyrophosphatase (non-canonical NTP hydrolase)
MTPAVRVALIDALRAKGHSVGAIFIADLDQALEAHGYTVVKRDPDLSGRAYIDAPLRSLVATMIEKLMANQHKGPWDKLDSVDLFRKGLREFEELLGALTSEDPEAIRREAADVANFMLMIHDLADAHVLKRDGAAV